MHTLQQGQAALVFVWCACCCAAVLCVFGVSGMGVVLAVTVLWVAGFAVLCLSVVAVADVA